MQTAIRLASRLVETASREPFGISFTLLTISMPLAGPAGESCKQIGKRLRGAFHARRNQARRDHRRFHKPR